MPEAPGRDGGDGVKGIRMGTTNFAWGWAGQGFAPGEGIVLLGLEEWVGVCWIEKKE